MLYILVFPLIILGFTAWASVASYGTSSLNNAGPHGLVRDALRVISGAGNNGSAFAGLNANTDFWNMPSAHDARGPVPDDPPGAGDRRRHAQQEDRATRSRHVPDEWLAVPPRSSWR